MTNAEATITENAATVAEQGTHVAPETASSKKGASQKKGAPKGQKAAKGGKAKASRKKEVRPARKPKRRPESRPRQRSHHPTCDSKGAKILEPIGRTKGAGV